MMGDVENPKHPRGLGAQVKAALAAYWRRVHPPTNECQWCSATISTGNPHHPFCSEQCKIEQWQAQQW